MGSGDRLRDIQMDQTPREDPGNLWSKEGATATEIVEAAFTLRIGMSMEIRRVNPGDPPIITINGRLRLQFENMEVWRNFLQGVAIVDAGKLPGLRVSL